MGVYVNRNRLVFGTVSHSTRLNAEVGDMPGNFKEIVYYNYLQLTGGNGLLFDITIGFRKVRIVPCLA